jgi:hypothetical protein
VKEKSIPAPTEELKAQCNAENEFSNFERVFRKVMAVPKAEVLKREAQEKHRNARAKASPASDDVERLTGRKPITFDQFAHDYAFAFQTEAKAAS